MIHNHPSGDPTPSQADIAMTKEVVEAARALRIAVHDHLVVGRDGTASFRALDAIRPMASSLLERLPLWDALATWML